MHKWWTNDIHLVFMLLCHFITQRVSQMLMGEECSGHFIDPVVGPNAAEVFHIVPEIWSGIRPVGHSRGLFIGHYIWERKIELVYSCWVLAFQNSWCVTAEVKSKCGSLCLQANITIQLVNIIIKQAPIV